MFLQCFNVILQPHLMAFDKRMPITHTSFRTTLDKGQHVESPVKTQRIGLCKAIADY